MTHGEPTRVAIHHASTGDVWAAIRKSSFAVLSHVTTSGEPRSSGVVYGVHDGRLYVAVAPNSWKARRIRTGELLALTIPVRRGGLLSLLAPIPPATISFHARATVHPAGSFDIGSVSESLESLVPKDRRAATVLELMPEGIFLTHGIGVSLRQLANPVAAQAHVPVA